MISSNDSGEEKQKSQIEGPAFADASDIPDLIRICRSSFRDSMRWQGLPGIARRWWENILSSDAAEVYVIRSKKQAAAFCLLIMDELAYKIRLNQQSPSLWLKLVSAMTCPVVVTQQLIRKIRVFMKKRQNALDDTVSIPWEPENRSWVELIAVDPCFRGRGLAGELLLFCEQRTRTAGKKAVVLRVDSDNQSARRLYEKAEYVQTAVNHQAAYYAKPVSEIDNGFAADP